MHTWPQFSMISASLLETGQVECVIEASVYEAVSKARALTQSFDTELLNARMSLHGVAGGFQKVSVHRENGVVRIVYDRPPEDYGD